jgi:hypothetical protein
MERNNRLLSFDTIRTAQETATPKCIILPRERLYRVVTKQRSEDTQTIL